MTVRILEDTLALLSLGKLCEEHGHSNEWASGQKPHPTKNGRQFQCHAENYVLIVVPGQPKGSSSSRASSSSTSLLQETVGGISSSPSTQRSDNTNAQASKNQSSDPTTKSKNKNGDSLQASRHRKRDKPEWVDELPDNLEDDDVPALRDTLRFGTSFESGIQEAQH